LIVSTKEGRLGSAQLLGTNNCT